MTSSGYLRYPHIHGDLVTFTADDDVWLVPASGGRAWKLSSDGAIVNHPRFSPDGSKVAWTSWRDRDPEVYVVDTDGSAPRRLTYWGDGQTRTAGWASEREVLAISAVGQPARQYSWAYAVPLDGPPQRLPYGPVADLALAADAASAASPGGERKAAALLTGRLDREPAFWKRYRGGTSGRLWTLTGDDPLFGRILADLDGQVAAPMLISGRLFFLADHEGTGNIYSCTLDGADLRRHTDHDGFYVRNPATDGQRIVYHVAGDVWLLDAPLDDAAEPRRLDITLGSPSAARAPKIITAADHLGEMMPDEAGQASVVEVRGTVHWLTHADGPARALSVDPAARASEPRVLGSEGMVIWVTDADGLDALQIVDATGESRESRRIAGGHLGHVASLAPSPDGAHVAVTAHDGRLLVVDVESADVLELAASDDGRIGGLSWSPDSAWLAWSQPGPRPLSRIRLARITPEKPKESGESEESEADGAAEPASAAQAGSDPEAPEPSEPAESAQSDAAATSGASDTAEASDIPETAQAPFDPRLTVVDVTDGRFADYSPAFTLDGLYLAFLSRRTFDPIYDAHSFDLSFPLGARPYLVPLSAETLSPFGPRPGGRSPNPPESSGDAERAGSSVDTEGIQSRVLAIPVDEARYSGLKAVKGGLIWLRGRLSGVLGDGVADRDEHRPRPVLERFDLRKRESSVLVPEVSWVKVTGDGSRLVVGDGSDVRVVPSDRKVDNGSSSEDVIAVDLTRARYLADPASLWEHAFEEAGRIIRRDYWTPGMSEVDWDSVLEDYRPLLAKIRSSTEFADLMREVVAELGTSHAYVAASGQFRAQASRGAAVGILGADVARDADGRWVIERVLPGESSDPAARSPLAAPGAAVRPGDEITEVDGRAVDPVHGPWPLLAATAGKPVELRIRPVRPHEDGKPAAEDGKPAAEDGKPAAEDGKPASRRVVIVPLYDDRRLRYQDWVAGRRRIVRERSDGRLGYLHIPDMMGEGWAHLHRDLKNEMAREALIIDVRGNRGGHTSQLIVEKLARRIIGWDFARYLRPESYPEDAPRGPVVALADEFSGSDGDIVTAAIKIMRLGPVIGARTWGGVIGINGYKALADGTSITVPQFAFWFGEYGWGVENHGVDPDTEVLITPDDWTADRDPQLEVAVDRALEALEVRATPSVPAPPASPSKRRPPLPPRRPS